MKFLYGLKAVDVCLAKHGEQKGAEQPFFFGAQYTLAEVLCAPFVARMTALFKEHRDIDVLDTCQKLGLTNAALWWKAILERPSTQLTTPAYDSNAQLAPYLRPVFVPNKLSPAEQAAAFDVSLKDWASGQGNAAEEARRKAELEAGMKIAAEERAKKQGANASKL